MGRATDFLLIDRADWKLGLVLPTAPFVEFVKLFSFDDGSGREYDVHVVR